MVVFFLIPQVLVQLWYNYAKSYDLNEKWKWDEWMNERTNKWMNELQLRGLDVCFPVASAQNQSSTMFEVLWRTALGGDEFEIQRVENQSLMAAK